MDYPQASVPAMEAGNLNLRGFPRPGPALQTLLRLSSSEFLPDLDLGLEASSPILPRYQGHWRRC